MSIDHNEFFRQATLRICGNLDIEKALFDCLRYIRTHIPLLEICLTLFEPGTGVLWNLATVDRDGPRPPLPPLAMPPDGIARIESSRHLDRMVKVIRRSDDDPVARLLLPHIGTTTRSSLIMTLPIERRQLGAVSLSTGREEAYTRQHVALLALLREPLSIAVSNTLHYQEVIRLKEMVDAENRELNRELRHFAGDEIVGADFGLKGVMTFVRQVAPLDSPVVVLGETGAGKEVIANAIHYSSPRRGGPFVKVNCGAIPDSLLDSELFGHEKGAFTGALKARQGRFERAHRGTIFLDEIGELPPRAQVRLLRVIQEKEIERVGGGRPVPVDVRVIVATHRNLEAMIREGTFREDLWYRLNIYPIMVPPLRQRREDIPALVHHFLERKARELKVHAPLLVSPGGMERLRAYSWPGNVRELGNVIEREMIRGRGAQDDMLLHFEHLREHPRTGEGAGQPPWSGGRLPSMNDAIRTHILRALEGTGGKIYGPGGAAVLLQVNPNTLRSRMRRLGIPFGRRVVPRERIER